jgi:hypothetical protein
MSQGAFSFLVFYLRTRRPKATLCYAHDTRLSRGRRLYAEKCGFRGGVRRQKSQGMARRQHPRKEARSRPCTRVSLRCWGCNRGSSTGWSRGRGRSRCSWVGLGRRPGARSAGPGRDGSMTGPGGGGGCCTPGVGTGRSTCGSGPGGSAGKVFTEAFPGIRPWGRTTDYAEGVLLKQLAGRSFRSTAHHGGVGVGTLRRLVQRRVKPQPDVSAVLPAVPEVALSLDEHSFRHQDMAVTVTVVSPRRQVVVDLPRFSRQGNTDRFGIR